MRVFPFIGLYGPGSRNEQYDIPAKNPLEPNAMNGDCGDAGLDGYTVFSRASRRTGERPPIGGAPEFEGPRLYED